MVFLVTKFGYILSGKILVGVCGGIYFFTFQAMASEESRRNNLTGNGAVLLDINWIQKFLVDDFLEMVCCWCWKNKYTQNIAKFPACVYCYTDCMLASIFTLHRSPFCYLYLDG